MAATQREAAPAAQPAPALPDFDPLLGAYAAHRTGYPPEVFEAILAAAPRASPEVLDVASGTGLSALGFAGRAARVVALDVAPGLLRASPVPARVRGRAEALPLRGASFDVAACAQAFHWMDPARALAELHRVLRPGGVAAVWWKYEAPEDPVARLAEATIAAALGAPAPHTPLARGEPLPAVAASPFGATATLRFDHRVAYDVEAYVGYQASRELLRRAAGPRRGEVLAAVRAALAERHGGGRFEVATRTWLHLLRKA